MKKITLISAAVAASLAFAPAAFGAGETQSLTVKLTSTKAGTTKAPTSVGLDLNTATTSTDPSGAKQTLTDAKIFLPKGIVLNYKSFPACADVQNCAATPAAQIGTGSAIADVFGVGDGFAGTLTPYIGPSSQLIIQTQFTQPAQINEPLIGSATVSGGAYTFDFPVPVSLQTPLQGADQQIRKFDVNFKAKTKKVGKKVIPLIALTSCPKGGYVFKGVFTFKSGSVVNTSTTVKCTTAKVKKKK